MKIGVISDTHESVATDELKNISEEIFADVSLIFHAGDITKLSVLEAFSEKKVFAVSGNMDRSDVSNKFPDKQIIELCGYKIGLIHGWGPVKTLEKRIIECFEDVHVIVYGHSHKSANHINNGILMFNPGAYSGTHPFGNKRSVGLLTISKTDGVSGTIINI